MTTMSNITPQNLIAAGLSRIASGFGDFLVSIADGQSRLSQVEALKALTDTQLAERGLKREDIVRFVFRDVYYV